ncbi:MAG: hypothetical protein IPG22_22710, partial [Acidobacteria bacterium]|nr:hypothetical protein [Acidobacteriota bacterium]
MDRHADPRQDGQSNISRPPTFSAADPETEANADLKGNEEAAPAGEQSDKNII